MTLCTAVVRHELQTSDASAAAKQAGMSDGDFIRDAVEAKIKQVEQEIKDHDQPSTASPTD